MSASKNENSGGNMDSTQGGAMERYGRGGWLTGWRRAGRAAVLGALFCLGLQGGVAFAEPTAEDYKKGVGPCMRAQAYDCAEKNWVQYLRLRPTDSHAVASLGIVLNLLGKHEQAVVQFQKAIDMGQGTYDLFTYYARSLEALGRTQEAIDWSYKALAVVPDLVDVRGDLARLLVSKGRHYEALSLLTAFDFKHEASGQPARFMAQRIAIESTLSASAGKPDAARPALRLSKFGNHFFVPVSLGGSSARGFMLDTGASVTTLSEELLAASKVAYTVVDPARQVMVADGRVRTVRELTLATLSVGPYELRDVQVWACKGCVSLLGQSTLARFDMNATRVQGVEFMTLSLRSGSGVTAQGKAVPMASDAPQAGRSAATGRAAGSTPGDEAAQPKDPLRAPSNAESAAGLALARECLDLDDGLNESKRHLDASHKQGDEEMARYQKEGRELADIRRGLDRAKPETVGLYNLQIGALNASVADLNRRMELLEDELSRFNDAVLARNEKCDRIKLNDRDYRTFSKERDSRRRAAAASTPAASAPAASQAGTARP
jgi:predicted aspartyl protease